MSYLSDLRALSELAEFGGEMLGFAL